MKVYFSKVRNPVFIYVGTKNNNFMATYMWQKVRIFMKKDLAKIQATYDYILDQFEEGDHLEDVFQTVNDNLEDFLAIGCEPAKLASMMGPVDVLTRIEFFEDIDINPVAKRLNRIGFEIFFKKLVELGVKADSIRDFVAKWDGETIVNHLADLQKCGFSKKELADLLHEKIDEYDVDFFNEEYLDIISASEHLYAFLCKEHLECSERGNFWTRIGALLEHGADKTVITKWIANHMTRELFCEDFREELCENGLFPSEEQIVTALGDMGAHESPIHDWINGDPNQSFMIFMNGSKNPCELITKLDDMSDSGITNYCEDWWYELTEDDVMELPNFWKSIAILFLETHNAENSDCYDLYCNLRTLDWLRINESEWRKILSGRKEWLEKSIKDCITESEDYPFENYSEEIGLLNRLLAFAS